MELITMVPAVALALADTDTASDVAVLATVLKKAGLRRLVLESRSKYLV